MREEVRDLENIIIIKIPKNSRMKTDMRKKAPPETDVSRFLQHFGLTWAARRESKMQKRGFRRVPKKDLKKSREPSGNNWKPTKKGDPSINTSD